jgi:putative N-acetyltransferase (TIGR04045 family)
VTVISRPMPSGAALPRRGGHSHDSDTHRREAGRVEAGLVTAFPNLLPPPGIGIYRIRLAAEPWELRGCARLRRAVFCDEQRLFTGSDRDVHDDVAQPIAAVSYAMGMADEVVGTVRIHEEEQGVWFGSRLAVAQEWRGVHGLSSGLIRAAVCTAHARGCHTFLATVQRQNVPMFRRLRWRSLQEVEVCGRPHQLMQADLSFYPPADEEALHMGGFDTHSSDRQRGGR